jgi:hypothetical protein
MSKQTLERLYLHSGLTGNDGNGVEDLLHWGRKKSTVRTDSRYDQDHTAPTEYLDTEYRLLILTSIWNL